MGNCTWVACAYDMESKNADYVATPSGVIDMNTQEIVPTENIPLFAHSYDIPS